MELRIELDTQNYRNVKCEQKGINRYRDGSNYERMSLIPRISTKEKKE